MSRIPDEPICFLGTPAAGARTPILREVRSPRALRTLARILVAFMVLIPVVLVLTPWQQTAVGSGRVVAFMPIDRQQNIEAPVQGRVVKWHVKEGSRVKQGDPIADISDIDPNILMRLQQEKRAIEARVKAQKQRARAIAARVARLRSGRRDAVAGAEARIRGAKQNVKAAARAEEAAAAAYKTAQLNIERQKALIEKGLTSQRQVELAELESTATRTSLERAQAARNAAKDLQASLEAERGRIGFDTYATIEGARASEAQAMAEIESTRALLTRLEVQLARQNAQSVRAPRDGTLLRFFVGQQGELVKPGDRLAVLVPDTVERTVELWVDGNDMPLISRGRKVRLQFEGWPALQFSGWPSVAVGTFGGIVSLVDATDDGKGSFRVLVVPDPNDEQWPSPRYLRQGVRANGWVLLEQVSLGFELWRRFNGFPPVVQQSASEKSGKGKGEDKEKPGKNGKPSKNGVKQ